MCQASHWAWGIQRGWWLSPCSQEASSLEGEVDLWTKKNNTERCDKFWGNPGDSDSLLRERGKDIREGEKLNWILEARNSQAEKGGQAFQVEESICLKAQTYWGTSVKLGWSQQGEEAGEVGRADWEGSCRPHQGTWTPLLHPWFSKLCLRLPADIWF